jgi:hypothetical protein
MKLDPSQAAQLRELLARLDRVATTSRGHRAGLHLYDRSLMDQYAQILITWEAAALGLPSRPTPPPPYSERSRDQRSPAPQLGVLPTYQPEGVQRRQSTEVGQRAFW